MLVIDITESQERALDVTERIASAISMFSGMFIISTVIRSPYYRQRIYHRIMMGCAVAVMITACLQMWGAAASPREGQPGAADHTIFGARGNTTTCSIQGFLIYVSSFAVPLYYISLSLLSLMAFRSKFKVQELIWIEKWIHIAVYAVPLSSGSYLFTLEAFNPAVRSCHLLSIPIGCGDESEENVPCRRGPENIAQLQNWFFVIPYLFVFIFPATIMAAVYIQVRFYRGEKGRRIASSVAKQSSMYLLVLYWTYGLQIIDAALTNRVEEYVFTMNLLGTINLSLKGVWVLFVYLYFRSDDPMQGASSARDDALADDAAKGSSAPSATLPPSNINRLSRPSKPKFSIFDGTDVGVSDSPWAAFLVDEYEDDSYKENCEYDDTDNYVMAEGDNKIETMENEDKCSRSED